MAKGNHFVEAERCVIKNTGVIFDNGDSYPTCEVRLIAETGLVMYKELATYEVANMVKYLNKWLEEAKKA